VRRDIGFSEWYEFVLKLWYVAVAALFIFLLYRLPVAFQIGLGVAAALLIFWVLDPLSRDEPPCGAAAGSEELVGKSRSVMHH
jgi:hypothetical protein